MKYFKIQATVRGSMTTIFEIVSGDDIDTHTKKTPYNHFDTLKDAKRHALDKVLSWTAVNGYVNLSIIDYGLGKVQAYTNCL